MDFEWDDAKGAGCLRERGFAFADVLPAFDDPARVILSDDRFDHGEARMLLFGRAAGRLFAIVCTSRGER